MKVIIPLAGPDFDSDPELPRPLLEFNSQPALKAVLGSRSWIKSGEVKASDLTFVLRSTRYTGPFQDWLVESYSGSSSVVLSELTQGALTSALSALGLAKAQPDEPICIDLADIIYSTDFSPSQIFQREPSCAGIIPYFEGVESCYSYLELNGDEVMRAREKERISSHASAGTYFFRTASDLLSASAWALANQKLPNRFFVCPVFNALIEQGRVVKAIKVSDVTSLSALFHKV